jgi:hypothetical protein
MDRNFDQKQLHELLYQALETEMGGAEIYAQALKCVVNEDLQEEWREYLAQTKTHIKVLQNVFSELQLDPESDTPGRSVCRHIGESLVSAMKMAKESGDEKAAELVATECIVLAETKDHLNWELIGHCGKHGKGRDAAVVSRAHAEVEEDEDNHLYHTTGFCRELWIDSLGFPAVLPPPEERKNVKTAIGASRAEHARDELL